MGGPSGHRDEENERCSYGGEGFGDREKETWTAAGSSTIAFRMIEKEMCWNVGRNDDNAVSCGLWILGLCSRYQDGLAIFEKKFPIRKTRLFPEFFNSFYFRIRNYVIYFLRSIFMTFVHFVCTLTSTGTSNECHVREKLLAGQSTCSCQ